MDMNFCIKIPVAKINQNLIFFYYLKKKKRKKKREKHIKKNFHMPLFHKLKNRTLTKTTLITVYFLFFTYTEGQHIPSYHLQSGTQRKGHR